MRVIPSLLALIACVALSSCAKKVGQATEPASAPAAAVMGQENQAGSFLAYAHSARVRLPADQIAGRLGAVRQACMERRHGECTVLGEEQSAGEYPGGELRLRAEPKAIEPLVAMAADGGELAQRSTQAEDLADAVRDNGLRQARLRTQHARLSEFLERRDIKAEDLIALSNQLSQIEAELQMAEQESAQQQRRIRTNLLTLEFSSDRVTVASSSLGQALRGSVDTLDESLAVLVTLVVALAPFALVAFVLVAFIRFLLRRRVRERAK